MSESAVGGSILVVDDEPSSRELVDIILNEDGYTTEAVPGGREALERLAARRFDIVVTDLQMPGMDGLELTQAIRERHPLCEVLILTAFSQRDLIEHWGEPRHVWYQGGHVTFPLDPAVRLLAREVLVDHLGAIQA